ncbi:hypothetical protein VPH35_046599 [Triticum aestivum]
MESGISRSWKIVSSELATASLQHQMIHGRRKKEGHDVWCFPVIPWAHGAVPDVIAATPDFSSVFHVVVPGGARAWLDCPLVAPWNVEFTDGKDFLCICGTNSGLRITTPTCVDVSCP